MAVGELHLTRLKSYLTNEYEWLRKEILSSEPNLDEKSVFTRLLLGFALDRIASCPRDDVLKHITDGVDDRGIDAFYYDRLRSKAYVFQSKFVSNVNSSPISETDARSFMAGIQEIFSASVFTDGNLKIKNIKDEIIQALESFGVSFHPVLVSTSGREISNKANNIIKDSLDRSMGNKHALGYYGLSDLYEIVSPVTGGAGTEFRLALKGYNVVSAPFNGYYGWVTGATLASLFQEHRDKLFAKNLRTGLGKTQINDDIYSTALEYPEKFWYFNNGVTFVSEEVKRAMRGGAAADDVELTIKNGSIVNGAQTTSSLGRLLDVDGGEEALARIKCLVRILEIPSNNDDFSADVTRFNNSQNGIGVKDFVSLDPFQQELRRGLDRDFAVNYVIRSGEDARDALAPVITLQEATVSLVACGELVETAVRAKEKISSLWRDTTQAPYTVIFDRDRVTPLALYKAVRANRTVEHFLKSQTGARERQLATHGNRFFAFYVLSGTNIWREEQSLDNFMSAIEKTNLSDPYSEFVSKVFELYGSSYKAPLFKNRSKCINIIESLSPLTPPVN